jgi:hypothetical protein
MKKTIFTTLICAWMILILAVLAHADVACTSIHSSLENEHKSVCRATSDNGTVYTLQVVSDQGSSITTITEDVYTTYLKAENEFVQRDLENAQRREEVAALNVKNALNNREPVASMDGLTLTLHDYKCNAKTFEKLKQQTALLAEVAKAGFTTLVYTNDKKQTFTLPLSKN